MAVKDSLQHFVIAHLDLRCLLRHRLCGWLTKERIEILLETKIRMENDADNIAEDRNLPSRIESTTRFLKR